jgi:hypothetical protein
VAYVDQAALADDETFRGRVRVAMVTAAINVMGEAKETDDQIYGKRQALAYQVLTNSGSYVDQFSWSVAANVAITASSIDSDIQFTVNSLWDDLSGVRAND